jgi:hypothetical protein
LKIKLVVVVVVVAAAAAAVTGRQGYKRFASCAGGNAIKLE